MDSNLVARGIVLLHSCRSWFVLVRGSHQSGLLLLWLHTTADLHAAADHPVGLVLDTRIHVLDVQCMLSV